MVSVVLPVPPEANVRLFGLRVAVGLFVPEGETVADSAIVVAKLPRLASVIVLVPWLPGVIVKNLGLAVVVKSGSRILAMNVNHWTELRELPYSPATQTRAGSEGSRPAPK
jgi:hypothetical protein